MKRINKVHHGWIILLAVCLVFSTAGCSPRKRKLTDETTVRLLVITDTHFLADSLFSDSSASDSLRNLRDGKEVVYTHVILDAFIEEATAIHPDAVIICGDLTFNGEKKSHEQLTEILRPLRKAGIPVLVIPGNHDIRNPSSINFSGEKPVYTQTIEAEDFPEIYQDYGYRDAYSRDENSLSYLYKLTNKVWIMGIDSQRYMFNSNAGLAGNSWIQDGTYEWMKEMYQEAEEEGAYILPVTHQLALMYEHVQFENNCIGNGSRLRNLMSQYHMPVVLSGHIHVQTICSQQVNGVTLYDCASEALPVYGNQYADVTLSAFDSFSYHAVSLDIARYAREHELTDENLLNYPEYSLQHFQEVSENFFTDQFAQVLPEKQAQSLGRWYGRINPYVYEGDLDKAWQVANSMTQESELRQKLSDNPYVRLYEAGAMFDEDRTDQRNLSISLK